LNRALYVLSLVSFLFPFATVRSCSGDEGISYTGVELLREDTGVLLLGVLSLAVVLFALSFRRRLLATLRLGLVSASKALLCALAIITTVLAIGIPFLFSRVSVQLGFIGCVGAWFVLYLISIQASIRYLSLARHECSEQPPPWGLAVGFVVVVGDLLTVWLSQTNDLGEVVLGILASLLVGAPVLLVAMLLAVRYRLGRQGAVQGG
jgi:hypothetical protein